MNYCKVCGKKLELTPEYDMCMECQGKQHQTFTLPSNNNTVSNKTEMTTKERLNKLTTKQVAIDLFNIVSNGKYDMNDLVNYFDRIDDALAELEELKKVPTAEEISVILSENSSFTVFFSESTNEFCYFVEGKEGPEEEPIVESFGDNDWVIRSYVNPEAIEMIGKFYKSLKKENRHGK